MTHRNFRQSYLRRRIYRHLSCHRARTGRLRGPRGLSCGAAEQQRRKPLFLLRLPGWFLLRFAERQLRALLFQLPPRKTRLSPDALRKLPKPFAATPVHLHAE